MIEAKLVGLHLDSFDELGVDAFRNLMSPITTTADVPGGGINGEGQILAVNSDATGGPADVNYFLYDTHKEDGALPILNENFISPFGAVKPFFLLPTIRCLLFAAAAAAEVQGFPGRDPAMNVADTHLGNSRRTKLMRTLFVIPRDGSTVLALPGT